MDDRKVGAWCEEARSKRAGEGAQREGAEGGMAKGGVEGKPKDRERPNEEGWG